MKTITKSISTAALPKLFIASAECIRPELKPEIVETFEDTNIVEYLILLLMLLNYFNNTT